jgi:diaminopimelate epimerase
VPSGALAAGVVAWARVRTTDIEISIEKPGGGSIKISAKRMRMLDAKDLAQEIERLHRVLED